MNEQLSENEKGQQSFKEMLKKCLPQLFLFEFIIKLLVILVGIPIIQAFVELMLELNDREIVFNEGILYFLTSWSGLLGSMVLFVIICIGIYFEFSVVTFLIYSAWHGETPSLDKTMKVSLTKLHQLKHVSSIGFGIYSLVILPIAGIGIASSLLPDLAIPNFITGELQKTVLGQTAVLLFYSVIFCVAGLLIFSLPVFILEKGNYFHAIKTSCSIIKQRWKSSAGLAVLFLLIHFMGEYVPELGQGYLFTMPVFYSVWDLFQLIALNLTTIFQLFLVVLKVVYPILLYILVVRVYLKTEPVVFIEEERLPEVEEQIQKTYTHSIKLYGWLKRKVISLRAWLNQKVFYKKHHKKIKIVAGIIMVWLFLDSFGGAPKEEPIIIGHRGSLSGVENTIEAIDGAIQAKADYVEIDVLLSKDSVPMVIHDENLTRLAGIDKNVYDLTAKELQEINLTQNKYKGKISTLDEVIKFADKKIKLLIEYKSHGHEKADLVESVMTVVEKNKAKGSCIFQAMDYSYIQKMKKEYSDYPIGYTAYGSVGVLNTDKVLELEVDFLSVEEAMVTAKMIQECNRGWVSVYVWTVNDSLAVSNYVNDGVVGIITDLPAEARKAIE